MWTCLSHQWNHFGILVYSCIYKHSRRILNSLALIALFFSSRIAIENDGGKPTWHSKVVNKVRRIGNPTNNPVPQYQSQGIYVVWRLYAFSFKQGRHCEWRWYSCFDMTGTMLSIINRNIQYAIAFVAKSIIKFLLERYNVKKQFAIYAVFIYLSVGRRLIKYIHV